MNYSKKNRKPAVLLIIICVVLNLLTACGQDDGIFINKEYNETGMLTINKTAVNFEESIMLKPAGVGLQLPPDISGLLNTGKLVLDMMSDYGIMLYYIPENFAELVSDAQLQGIQSDSEEMKKIISESTPAFCSVMRISAKDDKVAGILQEVKNKFSHVDVITVHGKDTYYLAYNDDFSGFTLSEKDKAAVDLLAAQVNALKNNFFIFPLGEDDTWESVLPAISSDLNMNDFSAETLDGSTFTTADLAKYDLTMVNIWTTWCTFCVEEMPDMQKLYSEMLPDNVNLITICGDANDETELARETIEQLKCTFKTLIPDEKIQESILKEIQAFPTTIFVDSKGNIVGEPQVGEPSHDGNIADGYLKLINERLEMVVKGQ